MYNEVQERLSFMLDLSPLEFIMLDLVSKVITNW